MEQIFFVRDSDDKTYQEYVNKYSDKLNEDTLNNFWTPFKHLYDFNEYDHYRRYVFSLIKKWMDKNEVYSFFYISRLNKLFKRYGLEKELNNVEKTYMYDFENTVFNSERNLKSIPVEFSVAKDEKRLIRGKEPIYFIFEDIEFTIDGMKNSEKTQLYLGETKLLLLFQPSLISIKYDDIVSHRLKFPNMLILNAYNKEMIIYSDEIKNVYKTFERVYYANK